VALALGVVVAALALGGGDGGGDGGGAESPPDPAAEGTRLKSTSDPDRLFEGIPQDGIALGDPKAPVTLVEYVELQCDHCATFARVALPEVVNRYVRAGSVRLELRLLRFAGPDSREAAAVAVAAGEQDRLWDFTELFLRNQGPANSGYVTDEFLRRVATGAGLDADRLVAAAKRPGIEKSLAQNETAAAAAGVTRTPSFFGGRTGGPMQKLVVPELTGKALGEEIDRLLGDDLEREFAALGQAPT
jgi:protein-disulfide isomerase